MASNLQNNILNYLNKIEILNTNVSREYLEGVLDSISIIKCIGKQQFILEGSLVNGLFFLCEGKAKVLKTGIHGREQILRLVKEGEIIGHRGFGTRKQYAISASTIDDSVLCHISHTILEKMLREIPDFTYDLMLFYAKELNTSESKVKAIAQMTVREKVIDTFLYIHRKFGTTVKGFLDINLSRKEIAAFAGTTDEQVTRTISALKKEGLIKVLGKRIEITDIASLKSEITEHNYFLDS